MINKMVLLPSLIVLYSLLTYSPALSGSSKPIKAGDQLPLVELPTPQTLQDRSYLGIGEESFFVIPRIKADIVVVYLFDCSSRFCAMQVSYVNELYRAVEKNHDLKEKIKFIGIGLGNAATEVNAYRETHRISFPLIPDTDAYIYEAYFKMYGRVMTPYFIILRIKEDGDYRIICCAYAFRDINGFLELILEKSELTKHG